MKCASAAGASLGILLLASLKNASTVPASSGRAIATLDLGESSDTSYSERVTVALKRWIEKADKCSGSLEIWYENECNELASRDTPSCAANQWLVLEKPKESDQRRYIRVKPKCAEIPCKVRTVWWGPLQKCIQVNDAEEVCGKGNVFRADPFGDIHCACPFSRGQLTDGDDCPEYYQQDPRKNDEGSVSTPEKCAPDSGHSQNKLKYADKEKARSVMRRQATSPPEEFSITEQIKGAPCYNFDPILRKCPGGVSVEPGPKEPYEYANRGPFN